MSLPVPTPRGGQRATLRELGVYRRVGYILDISLTPVSQVIAGAERAFLPLWLGRSHAHSPQMQMLLVIKVFTNLMIRVPQYAPFGQVYTASRILQLQVSEPRYTMLKVAV